MTRKTIKIKYWTQMVDLGDGSAAERKYKTKKLMEEDVERERESGSCFCDSTGSESFEVDVETGEIVTEGFFYTPDEY